MRMNQQYDFNEFVFSFFREINKLCSKMKKLKLRWVSNSRKLSHYTFF